MKKIMFNDRYGLTEAVLQGRKTMTRRIATSLSISEPNIGWVTKGKGKGKRVICRGFEVVAKSYYAKGEIVAISQCYAKLNAQGLLLDDGKQTLANSKGWSNKMYVKADLMPHQIRITDVRIERLQDISDDDCLREGIYVSKTYPKFGVHNGYSPNCAVDSKEPKTWFDSPRKAFSVLIDGVSGKGTWKSNPFVFVYEFELIK